MTRVRGARRRPIVVGGLIAIATVALVAGVLVARHAAPAGLPASPSDYPAVDESAIKYLAEFGTDVSIIATETSPEEAISVAADSFGQTANRRPQEVSLAEVTVRRYGVGSEDSPDTKDLKLIIENRRVWLVVFDDFKNFRFGPAPTSGESSKPAEYELARLVVYVDEATNQFLRAETIAK